MNILELYSGFKLLSTLIMSTNKWFLIFLTGFFFLSSCKKNRTRELVTGIDWPVYQGGKHSNQYSPLDQINKENVKDLQVAWEFHTGDKDNKSNTQIQCNPLIINGILYGSSPKLKVFALDAATGEKIWLYDPSVNTNFALNVNRGLSYWEQGSDRRLFFTAGPYLYALNADDGKPIGTFGIEGRASLKSTLGEWAQRYYVSSTTPGVIFKDLLIIGTRLSESAQAAPGYIRAYDVNTGKVRWTFHTIPKPGEFGYETWPEDAHERVGGANSWAGMSLDEQRGVVYVPTGSAAFDFYGGNRIGENLFANCIIALDAATGERIWHYQTVHHDIWDRDLPAPPNLITVNHGGKEVDAVAQITKSGFVFLLDRDTGKPLFPVEEIPFQKSTLEGEETWPTQPIPTKPPPFARQKFTMEEVTDISQESQDYIAGILANTRTGEPYIPPSKEGTIIFPGYDGGGEWGGAAFDNNTGLLYVNSNEMAWILTMIDVGTEAGSKYSLGEMTFKVNCAICHGQDMQGDVTGTFPSLQHVADSMSRDEMMERVNKGMNFMPSFSHLEEGQKEAVLNYILGQESVSTDPHVVEPNANEGLLPYSFTGYNRFLDLDGYPAVKPPWGTLSAIDMNKGEIAWQVPLGELEELTEKGIPPTGTENYGGPVVTAGGLIFIGASKDEYFHVFDKDSGAELWKYKLPAGGYATPAVYEINGRQYVVIACGGGKMGTPSGDSYMAFTLPE